MIMKRKIKKIISDHPLFAILILAGIVRGLFLLYYYYDEQWDQLLVDSLFHNYWAQSIANGNIIGQEAFFRAPFYIYLLAGLYAVFGNSIFIARIFGFLIGISSVYVTGRIALRLFGKKTAIFAALIHAVYPIAIYFESELLVDSLLTFLVELSILCFLYAMKSKTTKWFALTGLILGLAAITKPTILALVPIYIIWLFMNNRNLLKSFSHSIILIGSLLIIIIPVTVRNLLVADDFVLISSSGGINFYIGNNASADGSSASMPPPLGHNWQIKDINYIAEHETGRELKASEISDFWFKKGIDWITSNKLDFLKLYLHKLYLCFNNLEISNNRDLRIFFDNNPILKSIPVNYALILALVSVAFFFLIVRRELNGQILFVTVIILSYLLIISLFFINARFRLPVVPLLIIIASYGFVNLLNIDKRTKSLKLHSIALIVGIGIFVLSYSAPPQTGSINISGGLFNQGNYYLYKGDYEKAINLYKHLLKSNSRFPDANLNLGVAYLRQGNDDSAEYYFRRETELFPNRADGYLNIASLHLINGRHLLSLEYADSALSLKPYHTEAIIIKMRNLAVLYDTLGLQKTIKQALISTSEKSRIWLEAGLIYSNWQMYDLAIDYLRTALTAVAVAVETDDRAFTYSGLTGRQLSRKIKARAAYQLGFIYGVRNDLIRSIVMSNLALSNDSSIAEAYVNLINGYRLSGKTDSARYVSQIALDKFPDHRTIQAISSTLK